MRRCVSVAAAAVNIFFLVASQSGCGGGKSSTTPTSGLEQRAFVAVQSTSISSLEMADAQKDRLTATTVSLGGSSPSLMIPGANSTTIVFNSGDNTVSLVDNIKETLATSETTCSSGVNCIPSLPGPTESMAASSDGKFVYAAIQTTSQVSVLALTAGPPITVSNIPATQANCSATKNCLPGAHRLVLSHNNAKLLVFNEGLNQFEVINTADNSVQIVTGTGLDHPAYAVFSSDDSKAYILNCGAECGGTQASVSVLDVATLTITQTVNVDAATIGSSDATNLYVAGTGPNGGSATALPLSSLTAGKPISIGDGFHQVIAVFQNKVIIGARTCSKGCLSIVDPSAGSAIVDAAKGDVTAVSPITPRKVIYTTEGGELRIYDVTSGQELLTNNTPMIDIVGKAASVLYVGPKT